MTEPTRQKVESAKTVEEKIKETFYFSFGGDGMSACRNRGCLEITEEQMKFLEYIGLAYCK
jgi:hypothetical protein